VSDLRRTAGVLVALRVCRMRPGSKDSHRRSGPKAQQMLAILPLRLSIIQRRALQVVVLVHVILDSAEIVHAPMIRRDAPSRGGGGFVCSTFQT
jgi:hypothetical protein